jgi:hypothetical protein
MDIPFRRIDQVRPRLYQAEPLARDLSTDEHVRAEADNPAPLNPGNPYNGSKTQNGFNTLGQPDIAATLAAVASEALKAVWFQKWFVHLRHRPESGGAIVHALPAGRPHACRRAISPITRTAAPLGAADLTNSTPAGAAAQAVCACPSVRTAC